MGATNTLNPWNALIHAMRQALAEGDAAEMADRFFREWQRRERIVTLDYDSLVADVSSRLSRSCVLVIHGTAHGSWNPVGDGETRIRAARKAFRQRRHRTLTHLVRHESTGPVSRRDARRVVRALLAGRHGSLGLEPAYAHVHGTETHTTGDRAGTRTLRGAATPAAPPAAA
ncbi:MAG TPA: hypothetical protein VF519_03145 [Mycobacteriales bacterium]|jgi:hypothetical protein